MIGHILLADDDETFVQSTAALLRREGYHCTCASDAFLALEQLQRDTYDVLIADMRMPGNESLEFVSRLAQQAADLPVILVTAFPSLPSTLQSMQLHVVAYLVKPFDMDELRKAVGDALARVRVTRMASATHQRLQEWQHELAAVAHAAKTNPAQAPAAAQALATLTLRNLTDVVGDLQKAVAADSATPTAVDAGHEEPALPSPEPSVSPVKPALTSAHQSLETALQRIAGALQESGLLSDGAVVGSAELLAMANEFSRRQWDILQHVLAGQRVSTIARERDLSPHTVRNHLKAVFRKLGVSTQAELIERFRR